MNTQIIAIANQKGGVGKTTTCANLGIGLAQAGKKVLLIDGDPQGSLTISLGHPQPDKLPFTLSDAMGRILMDEPLRPGEGILHHPEGVDLMPADIQLSGMEVSLVNAMSRETILRQYLNTLKGQYSHILIDCQPSLGMLTVNALAAANRIIIPVQAEYLPAKGLEQLLSTVNKVKRQINPKLWWTIPGTDPACAMFLIFPTPEPVNIPALPGCGSWRRAIWIRCRPCLSAPMMFPVMTLPDSSPR